MAFFDAVLEQGEDVGPTLDDDDRVAVRHWGRRESLVLGDVFDADLLAHLREDLVGGHDRIVEPRPEQFLRAVDDFFSLRCAHVLDLPYRGRPGRDRPG